MKKIVQPLEVKCFEFCVVGSEDLGFGDLGIWGQHQFWGLGSGDLGFGNVGYGDTGIWYLFCRFGDLGVGNLGFENLGICWNLGIWDLGI